FGDIFCELAAHESHANANEAFTVFGEAHRQLSKKQSDSLKNLRPLIADLVTYVDKVVPDTQLTVKNTSKKMLRRDGYQNQIKDKSELTVIFMLALTSEVSANMNICNYITKKEENIQKMESDSNF
ncbi:hypothetical protein COOONC_16900, partial [Cooperia oncophora]